MADVLIFTSLLLIFLIWTRVLTNGHSLTYEDARRAIIQTEDYLTTGGRIRLNVRESKVDDLLMTHKLNELSDGYHNPNLNAAGLHFFKAKELIERSKIFRFLHQMPKGANLHMHNTASVSSDWIIRNISYMPGLLRCTNKDNISILTFRQRPIEHGCQTQYIMVSDERQQATSVALYDRNLEKLINLYTKVPELEYTSIDEVWRKFQNMFATISDLLRYLPAFRAYHWQMLEELYNDNIIYAEIRMDFKELYDDSGRVFSTERSIRELINIIEQFRRQHPTFLGIKVIYSTQRGVDKQSVRDKMESFRAMHNAYPNFIIGFDLVGQEDKGKPLYTFVEPLFDLPRSAKFFFHAGETNWHGSSTDANLIDALLLNTTRIGHGFALMKHPVLWNAVRARNIAVEVSPISNQVLHLVWDMRNHPGGFFISQDIPIVICNDDPGFWGVKGLSYDYYYAFMSLAPNHAGLKFLKSLVWNSLRYSILTENERRLAYANMERSWTHFIDDVLQGIVF